MSTRRSRSRPILPGAMTKPRSSQGRKSIRLTTVMVAAGLCALIFLPTKPGPATDGGGAFGMSSGSNTKSGSVSVVDLVMEEVPGAKEGRGLVGEGERLLRGADVGERKKDGEMGETGLWTGEGIKEKHEEEKTVVETEGDLVDKNVADCLKWVIYDKPVKTGSTAVTVALQGYLREKGQGFVECTFETCGKAGREVCQGKRDKIHFVEHISPEKGLMDCLKGLGYYRVTSIRDPLDRWESAFLYNRKKKASHYGIDWNVTYSTFMRLYPDCSLYDYYDGLGKRCEDSPIPIQARIDNIISQYEEIIDLYSDDLRGQLRLLLDKDLKEENKSPRPDGDFREDFDHARLDPEIRLYNAFKEKQRQLVGKEPQICK